MKSVIKKNYTCFSHLIVLCLSVVAGVFFALSYTTGYIGIVYGEKNSIVVSVLLGISILYCVVVLLLSRKEGKGKTLVAEIGSVVFSVVTTLMFLLLLVDRVDAIGNCIIAPWDAGHGGEDSCYLSFVSLACFLASTVLFVIASFKGNKSDISKKSLQKGKGE